MVRGWSRTDRVHTPMTRAALHERRGFFRAGRGFASAATAMWAYAATDDLHGRATFAAGGDYGPIIVDLAGPRPDPHHLWSSQDETDQGFS